MAKRRERSFTCWAHGPFRAIVSPGEVPRCIRGCSRAFTRMPDGSLPPPPPPRRPARVARESEPDERMPADELRAELRRLLTEAPYGGKRPLALALGFRGRWALHSLRSIAVGRGHLYEAVRRRLSRRVHQFKRGEFELVSTGLQGPGKRLFTVTATRLSGGDGAQTGASGR
jgi:hypothetical protein